LAGAATVALATSVSWWLLDRQLANAVMIYLLGVVVMAVGFGYAASLTATALSVVSLDFFFTTPYLSLAIDDRRNILTFAVMAFVAAVISGQTRRVRRDATARVEHALERARLAEEAQRAQAEAQDERLRSALLSSVSHDLKTPLAAIKGAVTVLLAPVGEATEARALESLHAISGEVDRMTRLVQNLVDMTSLESGTLRVRKEWHSIEEIVGSALRRLDEQLEGRPVAWRVAPDASIVALDSTLIEQVIVNLVENALKYAPGRSPIEISAVRTGEGVVVEVADKGTGIPEGKTEAIFDKFYRASRTGVGMGLGLTICRGIVAAHEGRIWATNRPGGGASFRFLLPGGPAPPVTDAPS
jgi:two-component system sensor histidine kinase KdpD